MQRAFNSTHTVIYRPLFPHTFRQLTPVTPPIILGLGGNMGDTYAIFKKLLMRLRKHSQIELMQTSPLIKNPPFGYTAQDDFINAVVMIQSSMSPLELLKYILHTEYALGRRRSFTHAPRPIDIDIIGFKGRQIKYPHLTNALQIPHYDWHNRLSVILPLSLCKHGIKVL